MHSLSHNKVLYGLSLSAMLIAAMSFVSSYILPSTTSALTYSSDTDVSFTFDPTLSISLSNANINIDNLLPGLSSESSPITVHVNSNTPYGYSLFASVGNSTDYNTTSLVHKSNDNSNNNSNNNSIPSTFTSIATNASLPQLDADNTWGYSFSNDNGTTWSNYNGLPLYSTVGNNTSTNNPALLIDTKSPADSTESIDFKIAAKASATQASGAYNNVINFYAVGKPEPLELLYDRIARMNKGYQTSEQLHEDITTSNSGVFEYWGDSPSDASDEYSVYYYRGILEPEADQGEYGSDGKATTYPNYVKLSNGTCWRIVRTTGSGGVKMIYNGMWDAANDTCANSTTDAQIATLPFNSDSATINDKTYNGVGEKNIRSVGYTYANTLSDSAPLREVFGDNVNPSIIKQYIEEWYSTDMATSDYDYTGILEENAGYCNDRSLYNFNAYGNYTRIANSTNITTISREYVSSVRFGAYVRNIAYNSREPGLSLKCSREPLDLYATTTPSGGNGQLSYPIALITADEMSLAGSGAYTSTGKSAYNNKSWLNTGYGFWSMSPSQRQFGNYGSYIYVLFSNGSGGDYSVSKSFGVRPVISLKPGASILSGSGIANDPWVVDWQTVL